MPKISHASAKALVNDLRSVGINDEGIRTRLISEGFATSVAMRIIKSVYEEQNAFAKARNTNGYTYSPNKNTEDVREKPNAFAQFYEEYEYFKRDGCLSTWLVFLGVVSVLALIAVTFNAFNPFTRIFIMRLVGSGIVVMQLMFVVLLWNGKRIGYHGSLVLMMLIGVVSLIYLNVLGIVSAIFGAMIHVSLVSSQEHLLE